MATVYTPLADGELGRAANINSRLQQLEDAITVGAGLMRARTPWATLSANAASITINVEAGDNTLQLMATLQTDYAAQAYDTVLLRFNDDVSSTYTVRYGLVDSGAGGSITDASGTTGFPLAKAAYGYLTATETYGFLKMTIPLASSLVAKACRYQSVLPGAYAAYADGAGVYPAAVTITKITLLPVNGTVFLAGSRYALFGVN
jgi:hypothetical protein